MSNLNSLQGVGGVQNLGFGSVVLNISTVRGAFMCPPTYSLADSVLPTALAQLKMDAQSDDPAVRIYPIHNLVAVKMTSEELVVEKLGYGAGVPVREGFEDWVHRFTKGGLSLLMAARSMNGLNYNPIFYDAQGVLFGYNGGGVLAPFPNQFYWASAIATSDGSKAADYMIRNNFDTRYLLDFLAYYQVPKGTDLSQATGFQTINLTSVSGPTAGVVVVSLATAIGNINPYTQFKTALQMNSSWSFKNATTGTAIVPTSVVGSDVTKQFTVTLPVTAPPYPVTTGTFTGTLALPSTLKTNNMPGYEAGNVLTYTV